jgi:hypothetical protein
MIVPAVRYAFGSSPSLIRLIIACPKPISLIRLNQATRERVIAKYPYTVLPSKRVKYIVAKNPVTEAMILERKNTSDD